MLRTGWNDRRIKDTFGIVNRDEIDNERYYKLSVVLKGESTI